MPFTFIKRLCDYCHEPYDACEANLKRGMGRFCSMQCAHYARGHKPPITRKCPQCGAKYSIAQSRWDEGKGRYCSKKCYGLASREQKMPRPCDHCGTEVMVLPYKRRRKAFYCSRECFFNALKTGDWVTCEGCGKDFYASANRIRIKKCIRFCSRTCQRLHYHGPKHHLWTGGVNARGRQEFTRTQKNFILCRDGGKCVQCSRGFDEVTLQVDHIVPIIDGGTRDTANGQTLCVDCHTDKTTTEARNRALRK